MTSLAETLDARALQIQLELEGVPAGAPLVLVSGGTTAAASALFIELHRLLANDVPPDAKDPACLERERAVRVLSAFNDFIRRAWCDPRRTRAQSYLVRWSLILNQLNDGTRHPLVEPKSLARGGRTIDPIEQWCVRAQACVAFYCFECDGRDMSSQREGLDKIARMIAKDAPDLARAMRTPKRDSDRSAKTELADAIISWRRAFTQNKAPEIAQASWQDGCDRADSMSGGDPDRYAKHALAIMAVALHGARALTV
jgi:hypothetical protein